VQEFAHRSWLQEVVLMPAKVIIIEGADKVGKSALIAYLQRRLPGKVFVKAFGGPAKGSPDPFAEQHQKFNDLSLDIASWQKEYDYVILDRSLVGECAYHIIHNRANPDYLPNIHRNIVSRYNPLFIYIRGKRFLANAEQHDVELDKSYKIVDTAFMSFFAKNGPQDLRIINNYNYPSEDSRNQYITSLITGEEIPVKSLPVYARTGFTPKFYDEIEDHPFNEYHASVSLHNHSKPVRGRGPSSPRFAVFGEAPGMKGCGYTGIPFYYDRSGMLLRDTLITLGWNLDTIFVSNVFHLNPPNNKLYDFIDEDFYHNDENEVQGSVVEWMRAELALFEAELLAVSKKVDAIIFLGKTAWRAGNYILGKHNINIKRAKLLHPAYYLYKGNVKGIVEDYRVVFNDLGVKTLLDRDI
jgi:uracil-DNA glycosylase family 4